MEELLEAQGPKWRIELTIIRASSCRGNGIFDGVFVFSGTIRNTLVVDESGTLGPDGKNTRSLDAYEITLNCPPFQGSQTFKSARQLWEKLTTLQLSGEKK
jgi:hypothetical protein